MAMKSLLLLAAVASGHAFLLSPLTLRSSSGVASTRRGFVTGLRAQEQRQVGENHAAYTQRLQASSLSRDMWKIMAPAIPTGVLLSQFALPVQVVIFLNADLCM
jgi:hypothetical protein